jgi:hypothetical protein
VQLNPFKRAGVLTKKQQVTVDEPQPLSRTTRILLASARDAYVLKKAAFVDLQIYYLHEPRSPLDWEKPTYVLCFGNITEEQMQPFKEKLKITILNIDYP